MVSTPTGDLASIKHLSTIGDRIQALRLQTAKTSGVLT